MATYERNHTGVGPPYHWVPECEDCDCASQMPRDNNDPGAYPGPDPDCECECHG